MICLIKFKHYELFIVNVRIDYRSRTSSLFGSERDHRRFFFQNLLMARMEMIDIPAHFPSVSETHLRVSGRKHVLKNDKHSMALTEGRKEEALSSGCHRVEVHFLQCQTRQMVLLLNVFFRHKSP
jgi:hypothetical protein